MKKPTKRIQPTKLALDAETLRVLTTGGRQPETNWTNTTAACTKDLFCPSASGVC